jgi:hypothetical protein
MTTLHVGQKIRCTPAHLDGCTHTIRQIDDDGALWVEGLAVRLNPAHVEPIAPPYSIPAGCQEPQPEDDGEWTFTVTFSVPPDNCIPESARRILDMGRTQQAVVQQPADPRVAGIARAVANLSNHEKRLGASRWRP